MLKIGIDIHGVLDAYPEKYIALANMIRKNGGEVYIITGPPLFQAKKEIEAIARLYNEGLPFWNGLYSIVDWIIANDLPWHFASNGNIWANREEDWNMAKGKISKELELDFHFDDSPQYEEYFNKGVFCYTKTRK